MIHQDLSAITMTRFPLHRVIHSTILITYAGLELGILNSGCQSLGNPQNSRVCRCAGNIINTTRVIQLSLNKPALKLTLNCLENNVHCSGTILEKKAVINSTT